MIPSNFKIDLLERLQISCPEKFKILLKNEEDIKVKKHFKGLLSK